MSKLGYGYLTINIYNQNTPLFGSLFIKFIQDGVDTGFIRCYEGQNQSIYRGYYDLSIFDDINNANFEIEVKTQDEIRLDCTIQLDEFESVGIASYYYLKDFLLRALIRKNSYGSIIYGEHGIGTMGNYEFIIFLTISAQLTDDLGYALTKYDQFVNQIIDREIESGDFRTLKAFQLNELKDLFYTRENIPYSYSAPPKFKQIEKKFKPLPPHRNQSYFLTKTLYHKYANNWSLFPTDKPSSIRSLTLGEAVTYPSAYIYELFWGSPYAKTGHLLTTKPYFDTGYTALDIPLQAAQSVFEIHKLATLPFEVVLRRFLQSYDNVHGFDSPFDQRYALVDDIATIYRTAGLVRSFYTFGALNNPAMQAGMTLAYAGAQKLFVDLMGAIDSSVIREPLKYAASTAIESAFPQESYPTINSGLNKTWDVSYYALGFLAEMYLFNKLSKSVLNHLGPLAKYSFYREKGDRLLQSYANNERIIDYDGFEHKLSDIVQNVNQFSVQNFNPKQMAQQQMNVIKQEIQDAKQSAVALVQNFKQGVERVRNPGRELKRIVKFEQALDKLKIDERFKDVKNFLRQKLDSAKIRLKQYRKVKANIANHNIDKKKMIQGSKGLDNMADIMSVDRRIKQNKSQQDVIEKEILEIKEDIQSAVFQLQQEPAFQELLQANDAIVPQQPELANLADDVVPYQPGLADLADGALKFSPLIILYKLLQRKNRHFDALAPQQQQRLVQLLQQVPQHILEQQVRQPNNGMFMKRIAAVLSLVAGLYYGDAIMQRVGIKKRDEKGEEKEIKRFYNTPIGDQINDKYQTVRNLTQISTKIAEYQRQQEDNRYWYQRVGDYKKEIAAAIGATTATIVAYNMIKGQPEKNDNYKAAIDTAMLDQPAPNTVKWSSGSRERRKLFLVDDVTRKISRSLRKRKLLEDEDLMKYSLNSYLQLSKRSKY